jgi:peptide/nickel transport system substrate-binding protein
MEPLRSDDPRRVGRYTLVARLGAGGMGRVFLGFSPAGRPMAVKVVHPELARDQAFLTRFKQEVAAARRVSGAYTAPVVDAGDGDFPWFATTLVPGPPLTDTVEQLGPLPEVAVWRLAAGLAEALADVHSCGLIHRDLKPANVLLAADGPRVIDFGISRALDGTGMTGMTGTGMLIGTPGFMSPEQASGTPVGPPSDVFSLGGVLTFAANGVGPFGDGNPVVMIYRVVHEQPTLTGLSPGLARLVSRCLVKRVEDRATLPELMEIITANMSPVMSATSFWPGALAAYIGSYQASIAADARAWSPPAPVRAEPSPPPFQGFGVETPPAGVPVDPRGSGGLPGPTDVAVSHVERDEPPTITGRVPTPTPPQTPAPGYGPTPPPGYGPAPGYGPTPPPGYGPAPGYGPTPPQTPPPGYEPTRGPSPVAPMPTPPLPFDQPPTPTPSRRPRRLIAVVVGSLVLVLGALGTTFALIGSHSTSTSHGGGGGTTAAQPPGGFGTIPAESGTPHAGTVSFGLQNGQSPTWILPIVTAANNLVYNVTYFDYQMWRPLYWTNNGVAPTINPAMSLASLPVWSNSDTTATITMNPRYRWSDGKPVTSQDVAFAIDLIKAAVKENPANWAIYNRGQFPDDLASVSTPSQNTLVLNLTAPVNPDWFVLNELGSIQPMPAHAWAKAYSDGAIIDFTVPVHAKLIYNYLSGQSNATHTWAAHPLWRVVDGPYQLASYNPNGATTLTANSSYGGPDSHQITSLRLVPAASDGEEMTALEAGSIDVGYVPTEDVSQVPRLKSDGNAVFGYPDFGFDYAVYNFKDTTGDFNHIVAQLYFRQAMAHLEDEQHYISAFMDGAGSQVYGPVPPLPATQYAPANAKDPYPFSAAAARSLLGSHGWQVNPGGTDTCTSPGSGAGQCGPGIPAGTKLAFNLVYNNSAPVDREVAALAAEAKQVGISISLVSSTFIGIITTDDDAAYSGNDNKWAMEDFGGLTNSTYPTTDSTFNTAGGNNFGGYADPEANALINASVSGTNPDAVRNEAAYLTAQQPALFEPNIDVVFAWSTRLSGPLNSFANLTQYNFTPEQWYYTK